MLNQCIDIQASAEADRPLSGSRLRQQHRKARVLQLSDKVHHHHPGYLDSGMKIAIATVNAREDSDAVSKKTALHSMTASESLFIVKNSNRKKENIPI